MKVALLSFVKNINYGGSLQEYALEYAIKKYGNENIFCEYLNYHKNFYRDSIIWLARKMLYGFMRKDDFPSWKIKEFLGIVRSRSGGINSGAAKEFEKFWRYTDFSQKLNKKELRKIEGKYDIFIVGSDQVWNCGRLNLDTTYLLDFISDDTKKGSYASSIGLKKIPEKYKKKYLKYWNKFKYLSCREREGSKLIENLTGRKAEWVVDPTLLLDKAEWEKIADISVIGNEKYILLYMLDKSERLLKFAERVSQDKKLKIVKIYSDIQKNNAIGPRQWIGYFLHAECVVTNSFHGVAFSVNFNKDFYVEVTQKSFFTESSSRITDFLNELGLNERLIGDSAAVKTEKIQYGQINSKLADMREKSLAYLLSMLRD
ncbi:MAG: polysaccharide pyruvyl transferase family protein [Lachnospiraceae bacterium]